MLAFTFTAPSNSSRGPVVLVFVIERENLTRMTIGDPFDMHLKEMANASTQAAEALNCSATDLDIILTYEDDAGIKVIKELAANNDMPGVLRYIERGRTVYDGEPANPRVINA